MARLKNPATRRPLTNRDPNTPTRQQQQQPAVKLEPSIETLRTKRAPIRKPGPVIDVSSDEDEDVKTEVGDVKRPRMEGEMEMRMAEMEKAPMRKAPANPAPVIFDISSDEDEEVKREVVDEDSVRILEPLGDVPADRLRSMIDVKKETERSNTCNQADCVGEKGHEVHFCIDFQNRGCSRYDCHLVHVPREEADRYKVTKEFNLLLVRAIAAVARADTNNGVPVVCKELQTGKCGRYAHWPTINTIPICKAYQTDECWHCPCPCWHVNMVDERERRRLGLPHLGVAFVPPPPLAAMGGGPRGAPSGRGDPGTMGGPYRGPAPNNYDGPGYDDGPGGPMCRPHAPHEMGGDVKRPRMGGEMEMRMADMENRIAELTKENDGLKRVVQDPYALFRLQVQGISEGMSVVGPGAQHRQQHAPCDSQMGGAMWGASAPRWSA